MSAGEWLLASRVTGRTAYVGDPYPHVHAHRGLGRRGCAACVLSAAETNDEPIRRGNGGHECRPAGRGTVEDTWTCPDCVADWRAVTAKRAGVVTRTWERA